MFGSLGRFVQFSHYSFYFFVRCVSRFFMAELTLFQSMHSTTTECGGILSYVKLLCFHLWHLLLILEDFFLVKKMVNGRKYWSEKIVNNLHLFDTREYIKFRHQKTFHLCVTSMWIRAVSRVELTCDDSQPSNSTHKSFRIASVWNH